MIFDYFFWVLMGVLWQDVALQIRALALSRSVTGQNIVLDSGFSA